MATEVEIVNLAYSKLGQSSIAALSEDSVPGRLANSTYELSRDSVLRDHLWNFAMRRVSIAANATAPPFEHSFAYDLPGAPDYCLRVIEVFEDQDIPWVVEGRQILTDIEGPLQIVYTSQVTDTAQFDSQFVDTLATYLAAEWAEKVTGSTTLREQLTNLYALKLAEARSMDGQEGTPKEIEACEWVDARF